MVQGRLHGLSSSRTVIRRIWICRDSGAWWAAICGVSQSRIRLMWLSSSSSRICSIIRKIFQIQLVELIIFVNCYTNLESILKSRDITLPAEVRLVKAMVFPVVMYRCESWTIKKAECWRIDTFKLWCWRRLLRIPWTARRCTQSILKEISP